jgi:hypothetical protein
LGTRDKVQFDFHFLDSIDTEQKAYIIGFLQCDGSFSCRTPDKQSYYRYKLAIQEKDKEILHRIQQYTNHTGKISVQKPKLAHRQDIHELSFNGRSFVKHLHTTFGGYSKEDRLLLPSMEKSLMKHYIRGVFDADGSFGDYGGVMLRFEGKKDFLTKIAPYVGFDTEMKKGNGKTTYTMRLQGEKAFDTMGWLYSDLSSKSLYLERKYTNAQSVFIGRGRHLKGVA